jgi:hypothetical protein
MGAERKRMCKTETFFGVQDLAILLFLLVFVFTYLRSAKHPLFILALLNKVYWDNYTTHVLGHICLIRSGFYIIYKF